MRSPRTAQEQRQLLIARQPGWEYLLFAGVLAQDVRRLELKEQDHELQLVRGPRQHLDLRDAATVREAQSDSGAEYSHPERRRNDRSGAARHSTGRSTGYWPCARPMTKRRIAPFPFTARIGAVSILSSGHHGIGVA